MTLPRTYTIEQVAEILQVNERVVYNLVHTGELRAIRVGRQFRIPQEVLDAFMRGERPEEGRGERAPGRGE